MGSLENVILFSGDFYVQKSLWTKDRYKKKPMSLDTGVIMVNYSVLRTQYEKNYNYGAQRSSLNVVFTCESYSARCFTFKN